MTLHRTPHTPSRLAFSGPASGDADVDESPTVAFPHPDSIEVRDQLEELDDAMFSAIAGDPGALDKARALWFNAVASLPRSLVEESREQYLRCAAEVLIQPDDVGARSPRSRVGAIEVLELLARAA